MLTKIYIGSNPCHNGTPDDYTITSWLQDAEIEGATFYRGRGYWRGIVEDCIIVEVVGEYRKCLEFAKIAAEEWDQIEVMVVAVSSSPPELVSNVKPNLKLT